MEIRNEKSFCLWRCALPNIMGAAFVFARIALIPNLRETSLLWAAAVYAALSLALLIRAALQKKPSRIDPALHMIVCLLSFAVAQRIYVLPMAAQIIKQEFVLLLCSGYGFMSAAWLILSRSGKMDDKETRHAAIYGSVIPFFLALILMSGYMSNIFSTICLCGIVSLFCLGGLFLLLSFVNVKNAVAEEDTEKPKRRFRPHGSPAFITLFGVLFPAAGLMLNGMVGNMVSDFSSPWYYVIAILNGLAVLLSAFRERRNEGPSLFLFFAKSVGVVFVAYFALIFVPFLPLGVLGLLAAVGLLIFTPLILLIIEIAQLTQDYRTLCRKEKKRAAIAVMACGFVLLPMAFTGNALIDRVHYHRALSSIESTPSEARPVSAERLSRTITTMNNAASLDRSILSRRTAFLGFWEVGYGDNPPILSSIYSTIVFGNEPLPKADVERLMSSYFSTVNVSVPKVDAWKIERVSDFRIANFNVTTQKDESGAYRSWVDLEIRGDRSAQEFSTVFSIPEDCFVTDYYLFVGFEKKQGILSEKAAANQLYESIVNQNRDPGKLCYTENGDISLRIFPFARGEKRKTGFELLHAGPVTLNIEGITIEIGGEENGTLKARAAEIFKTPGETPIDYEGNAYIDAAILFRNTAASTEGFVMVVESFRQRVLTDRTCFLALESMEQENALKFLQTQIMNGESTESMISMDEPWAALLIPLLLVALLARRRYNKLNTNKKVMT